MPANAAKCTNMGVAIRWVTMTPSKVSKSKCVTLDVYAGIILKVTHIDRKTNEYLDAAAHKPDTVVTAKDRDKEIQKIRFNKPGFRRFLFERHMGQFVDDPDHRIARKVRNDLAHGTDTIADGVVSGKYTPPVEYTLPELKRASDAADRYICKIEQFFETNPIYMDWQDSKQVSRSLG